MTFNDAASRYDASITNRRTSQDNAPRTNPAIPPDGDAAIEEALFFENPATISMVMVINQDIRAELGARADRYRGTAVELTTGIQEHVIVKREASAPLDVEEASAPRAKITPKRERRPSRKLDRVREG